MRPVGALEGLKGYLLRLGVHNGYPDLGWIEKMAGLRAGYAVGRGRITGLADLTGVPASRLGAMAWRLSPGSGSIDGSHAWVHEDQLDLERAKVCPACLAEGAWIRRVWDLRLIVACPEHGHLFVDACVCGNAVDWHRTRVDKCSCGRMLADAAAPASASAVAVSAMLERAARSLDTRTRGSAPITSLDGLTRVIRFFAAVDVDGITKGRGGSAGRLDVAGTAALVERAAPVILRWPEGLRELLSARLHAAPGSGAGVRSALGINVRRLFADLHGDELGFLRNEVRRWLGPDGTERPVREALPVRSVSAAKSVMSRHQAAMELSVTDESVDAMVASGVLRARRMAEGGRCDMVVEAASVAYVLGRRLEWTRDRLAAALGVSDRQATMLVRDGVISTDHRAFVDGLYPEAVALAFIEAMEARLDESAGPPAHAMSVKALSLARQASLVRVAAAVLSGHLPAWRDPAMGPGAPLFRRVLVDPWQASVPRPPGNPNPVVEECMIAKEAARALGCGAGAIPSLIRAGCLTALAPQDWRPGRWRVTRDSIDAFRTNHCWAHELARLHGLDTEVIEAGLTSSGIAPVIPADAARRIPALYRWTDVEWWRPSTPDAGRDGRDRT